MVKVGVDNIIIENRQILLIQRSSKAKNYPNCWGFIGGWIEDGESPEQALAREAYEEIGVETSDFKFIGKYYHSQLPDGTTRIVLPHLSTIPNDHIMKIQMSEINQAHWFTFKEALTLDWAYDHKEIFTYTIEKVLPSSINISNDS